ncbi:hypothetical protein SCARR_01709 [Pontiella sulfatireligans]|uniref:Uncharacterized protein n=1 Tax=Pontiella sulfatireligans TaxID=2750658 RepID=A0A6C2UHI1_9BACT|nr:hypothetical protein [Pontiella sulfatireligans]VGO19650.1 hypothetical protein SCARR_01709 [Pontiella sulfatireligans]
MDPPLFFFNFIDVRQADIVQITQGGVVGRLFFAGNPPLARANKLEHLILGDGAQIAAEAGDLVDVELWQVLPELDHDFLVDIGRIGLGYIHVADHGIDVPLVDLNKLFPRPFVLLILHAGNQRLAGGILVVRAFYHVIDHINETPHCRFFIRKDIFFVKTSKPR